MALPTNLVSIHPYFKLQSGREAEARAIMNEFVTATKSEKDCLFYEFTTCEDRVFCREGYVGAAGVLAHLQNAEPILAKMLGISDLERLEFHGSAEEIDQLRGPLADLKPDFFSRAHGIDR